MRALLPIGLCAVLIVLLPHCAAAAGDTDTALRRLTAAPVGDRALAGARGGAGFSELGLQVAVAIRRDVQITNGVDGTVAAQVSNAGLASLTLLQRGGGNGIAVDALAQGAAATVIQNSLDNQQIRAVTTIDVQSTSLSALRASALQASIGNAVAASLRR